MSAKAQSQPAMLQGGGLLSIQALRGIAVMGVVFFHIQSYFSNRLQMPQFLPQFHVGAAGVDVFFVISGFVMVYASERLFVQPGGPRIFYLRRLARIVPMYWCASTVMLVYVLLYYDSLATAFGGASTDYVAASYFFIPYVRPDGEGVPMLGVGWTLNCEMFFYTVFGVLVAFSRRTVVIVIAAAFCVLIAVAQLFGPLPNPLAFWSSPLILEFVFGMGIALAYRDGVRLPPWLVWTLATAGLAIFAWSWSRAEAFGLQAMQRVFWWGLPALAIVGSLVLANRPVPRNRFWRIFAFLGDASYSIYLFHTLALGVPQLVLAPWAAPASAPWLYLVCLLIATTLIPTLVYLFLEKPLTEKLRRKLEPRAIVSEAKLADPTPRVTAAS
jgi:exopolysaccharide production protein ExoZ